MAKPRKGDSPRPASTPAAVTAPSPSAPAWRWVIALILLAALFRLPNLGKADLWVDELLFMWDSQLPMTPAEVWAHHYRKFPAIGHLPLGAAIHNAFLHLTGQSPDAVAHSPLLQRFPAVLWGIFSVPVLFAAARRLAGDQLARLAGVLFAAGFFPVFYAREAYYYAPLIFFSCASLLAYARFTGPGRHTLRDGLFFLAALTATALTHISGMLLLLAFALTGLIRLVATYVRPAREGAVAAERIRCGWMIGIPVVGALPLLPFIMIRMAQPGQQGVSGAPDWWMVLYDMLGKMFCGITPVAFTAAVIVTAAGAWALSREGGRSREFLLVVALLNLAILVGAIRTQYSARYFSVASPAIYLVFAAGFLQIGRWIARGAVTRERAIAWTLVGAFVLVHAVLFHRTAYALEAKARNYGGMARWINAHVPAGGAYLIESAYDVRFLGQYHRTPNATPMTPFFHSTAEDVARLRALHQDLIQRHPDVPFVEASRHGTEFNANVPVWDWPHRFYRQRADLWNHPLQRLVSLGIWPQIHAAGMPDIEYHTVIWYNRPEDLPDIARVLNQPAWIRYDAGWQFAQVAQGVYMRVHPPTPASFTVLPTGTAPVTGRLLVRGSVATGGQGARVRVMQGPRELAQAIWSPNRMGELVVDGFEVPADGATVQLIAEGPAQIQALLVDQIQLQ